jgi:hypothetical protein
MSSARDSAYRSLVARPIAADIAGRIRIAACPAGPANLFTRSCPEFEVRFTLQHAQSELRIR